VRRRMAGRVLPFALAVCVASGVAGAGSSAPEKKTRGELYLKVFSGVGLTGDSDLEIRQSDLSANDTRLTFSDVAWEDHSLEGPSARYTGVRLGYFLSGKPWLGVAAEFLHFKVFAEVQRSVRVRGRTAAGPIDTVQPMSDIVARYNIANGVNFIPVSVIARKRLARGERFPNGRVQPYAGFGVGPTLLYPQNTVNGRDHGGPYELGRPGLQALGGIQVHVSPRWELFAEYKRTYTDSEVTIRGGTGRSRLQTDHFTLGGGVHF